MKRTPTPPRPTLPPLEERALAERLAPPSTLEQLAEWRAKVAARLAKAPRSRAPSSKSPPRRKG